MKDEMDYYKKTGEILRKFKNGEKLFRTSPVFNAAVQMLVRGASEYEVMEQLIQSAEDTKRAFEQHLIRSYGLTSITPHP